MNSKFQHHDAQLITVVLEMLTYWTLWFIRLSGVLVSDTLDSDHLPVVFHVLDDVKTRDLSEPIEKFTYWELFQSLASIT
jgi:hypothetical protein